MGFIDSYKHLEKLCGEIMNDNRRISAYIDEMLNTPGGPYYVGSWNEDLKKLKHYRWVRNQIYHEPGCTEENMCEPQDELWLDDFYSRIMDQTDPLALYRKATNSRTADKPSSTSHQNIPTHTQPDPYIQPNHYTQQNRNVSPARNSIGCATMFIVSLLIVAAFVLF